MNTNVNFTVLRKDNMDTKMNKVMLSRLDDMLQYTNYEIVECDFEKGSFSMMHRDFSIKLNYVQEDGGSINPVRLFDLFLDTFERVADAVDDELRHLLFQELSVVLKLLCRFSDLYYMGDGFEADGAFFDDVPTLNKRLRMEFDMDYTA